MADEPNNFDDGAEEPTADEPQDAVPGPDEVPADASEVPQADATPDADPEASEPQAAADGDESTPEADVAAGDGLPPDTDDHIVDQAELDALTAQIAAADGADVPDEAAAPNTFSQAELDALAAEVAEAGGEEATAAPPKNTFDQAELDALASQLANADDVTDPTDVTEQAVEEIDALAAEMAAAIAAEAGEDTADGAGAEDDEPARVVGDAMMGASADEAAAFEPPDLAEQGSEEEVTSIDMLDDVELDVKIELGRTDMYIEDVLRLGAGSVVELDKLAGDPVDIYVNGKLLARGEVLVLNDNFCVRINDIHSPIPELDSDG